ncbi:hypothetical protein KAH27_04055 [bacterium]|nr:hypothetical protein [bacterium]
MNNNQILLGAAEIDITPKSPVQLVGMGRVFVAHDGESFEYSKRDNPTSEIHDPLMLQATCLCQDDKKIIILTADLLYTVALKELQTAVAQACGVSEESIFYAVTHNHNGPCGTDEYITLLCKRAAECAKQAAANLRPVIAEQACGNFDRLSYDRAEPWGEVDGSVNVIKFTECETGKLVTMWWNYGCHPCSLSWDFNQFSADYPGIIRKKVSEILGESVPISFMLGCAGNVQPSGIKRFTEPPQMYLGVPKGDFEIVELLGNCIVEAGLFALENNSCKLNLNNLQFEHYNIDMPIYVNHDNEKMCEIRDSFINLNSPKLHDSDPTDDLLKDASKIMSQWVDDIIKQGDNKNKIRTISGGMISLGDIAVVFTPLEVAWQIGVRIREKSPFPVTLISTASLGFESYLTEKKFYELKPELRPYETFGLQVMAGFTYTPETPAVFESAVISKMI